MKLYEITNAYAKKLDEALQYAEDNDGEIPSILSDEMDELAIAKDDKIDTLIKMYKNECSISVAIESEIKCLKDRMRAHDNKADWIKRYIRSNIQEGEKKEFACGKIGWRKSTSVDVLCEDKLPADAFVVKKEVSKTKVKEMIDLKMISKDVAIIKTSMNMQVK